MTSKILRSFFGAVNQFTKFNPILAAISYPFTTTFKKEAERDTEHEEASDKINEEIMQVAELALFKRNQSAESFATLVR